MNIGLDVGYSETKAVADGGRRVSFPSAVGTPDKARFSVNGTDATMILTEPDHVQVGRGAINQSRFIHRREDRRWIESPEWYDLALAAISGVTKATRVDLYLVTGLPVAFYNDKDLAKGRLLGNHVVQREGRHAQSLHVTGCKVIPQPFGALLSATLNDRGRIIEQDLATGTAGILDIGGKTTNLLSVNRLSEIGHETESVNVGAWDAVRSVRRWLADNCPDLDLRDHEIINAIIDREVGYYGDIVDLTDPVEDALHPLAREVVAVASQIWNGGANLAAILISGGGALLLGPYICDHFPHARVVDDPVFANALGYWRFAAYVQRRLVKRS
jgi:plasmid segregation protein ParM